MNPSLLSFVRVLMFALGAASLEAAADYTTPYFFTTLAGTSSIGSQNGTGAAARFFSPRDVTTDAQGNIFIVDQGNHTIRKIAAAGVVTTFAGSPGEEGSSDGIGNAARFNDPQSIVTDPNGNLFVADSGNHTIRKITPNGTVTTLAGLAGVTGNADGVGSAARFNRPQRIGIAANGVLFVADSGNRAIRKITPEGIVSHYATASFAEIVGDVSLPFHALAVDAAGNVHAAQFAGGDTVTHQPTWGDNYTTYSGSVSSFPSGGTPQALWLTSWRKYFDGRIENHVCTDLEFDSANNVIAVDGPTIRRASLDRLSFMPLAGDGTLGSADGAAASAKFGFPIAFAYDRSGNLIIADTGNNVVRTLAPTGEVSTVAGLALERAAGTADGSGAAARFAGPIGTAVDATGNVYVTDASTHCIRRITPSGVVTTLAGTPGQSGTDDGAGTAAKFNGPRGLALGPDGALYVSDTNNHTIRRVALDGTTSTFAGRASTKGWDDGPRATAHFWLPYGLGFDSSGNLYVVSASTVRKITPAGEVSTLAGFKSESGYVDDIGHAARFTFPYALTVDSSGSIYVTEAPPSPAIARIRKISSAGNVTTLTGAEKGYADGALPSARFDVPSGIVVDANRNLFVTEYANQVIRKITATGAVSTVAGLLDAAGDVDGIGRKARFVYPQGIAIDASGALYVTSGTTVRKGVPATAPSITSHPRSQTVSDGTSVTFSAEYTGAPPASHQWFRNGEAVTATIQDSTNTGTLLLTLPSVRSADAGDYTVVLTNEMGSVTSNKATLTVNAISSPPSPSAPASGGGGAPSLGFAAVIATVLLLRARRHRCRAG